MNRVIKNSLIKKEANDGCEMIGLIPIEQP